MKADLKADLIYTSDNYEFDSAWRENDSQRAIHYTL